MTLASLAPEPSSSARWHGPVLREIEELGASALPSETVYAVPGARVVFANHDLLRHDFPALRAADTAAIERWLLENAAFLSGPQCQPSDVRDGLDTSAVRTATAYRPPRYGRAVVVPVPGDGGLLDVKGAGVAPGRVPRQHIHGDGFLWLGEAIFDYINQCIIEQIFARNGHDASTLPVYGLIDLGLDGRLPWRELRERYPPAYIARAEIMKPWSAEEIARELEDATAPVAVLVRRAHRRDPEGLDLPALGSWEQEAILDIELLLRRYGITSCFLYTQLRVTNLGKHLRVAYGPRRMRVHDDAHRARIVELTGVTSGDVVFDGANVQLTRNADEGSRHAQLVDFGQYFAIRGQFRNPLLSRVRDPDALLRWGGALYPEDARYVQPSPELRLEEGYWGKPAGVNPIEAPKYVYWAEEPLHRQRCMQLADQYRAGLVSRQDMVDFIEQQVQSALRQQPADLHVVHLG
ncbi:MAG TPA: hypothetical protein VMW27_05830 [Thermoanaerobaculia bacterium]|nr:hypothetical protein [Thermoanaerobaculia bacterium]